MHDVLASILAALVAYRTAARQWRETGDGTPFDADKLSIGAPDLDRALQAKTQGGGRLTYFLHHMHCHETDIRNDRPFPILARLVAQAKSTIPK